MSTRTYTQEELDSILEAKDKEIAVARQEGRDEACDLIYDAINDEIDKDPTYNLPSMNAIADFIEAARSPRV